MGNRAVICNYVEGETLEQFESNLGENEKRVYGEHRVGVYLHWNGGEESIRSFLMYCKLKGYRATDYDNYGWARLCQVIGNFFGGGLSLGIAPVNNLDCDNGNNGTYLIKDWEIIDKYYDEDWDKEQAKQLDIDLMIENLLEIDQNQPVKEQLGKEQIEELVRKEYYPSF